MTLSIDAFRQLKPKALKSHLEAGFPIDPTALNNSMYRGISLGLPHWVEAFAWTTFIKTFHRDPETQGLRGWNVRLNQTGIAGEIEPQRKKDGSPRTFGHFAVTDNAKDSNGLLIDYGLGGNGALDPTRYLKDPIVALEANSVQRLLGWTYLDFGRVISTPSYFLLERIGTLDHVAYP